MPTTIITTMAKITMKTNTTTIIIVKIILQKENQKFNRRGEAEMFSSKGQNNKEKVNRIDLEFKSYRTTITMITIMIMMTIRMMMKMKNLIANQDQDSIADRFKPNTTSTKTHTTSSPCCSFS